MTRKYDESDLLTADELKAKVQQLVRQFYIYILCDVHGVPFYVGKACKTKTGWYYRPLQHCKDAKAKRKSPVCRHIRTLNHDVRYVIHFDTNSEWLALFEEQVVVLDLGLKRDGGLLYNRTIGGQGMQGHQASLRTRRKMSKTRTGRTQSKEHNQAISLGRLISKRVKAAGEASKVPVKINGVVYSCRQEAADALNLKRGTLSYRVKVSWPGYEFA
jgi:hypothetical protein